MALEHPPRALLFDVFGTCVDWRTTVTGALEIGASRALHSASNSLSSSVRLKASNMTTEDWGSLAQAWRNTYKVFTKALAEDPKRHWKSIDDHHLDAIRELLVEWELDGLWKDDEVRALSLIWHRLDPWTDSSPGITELNKLFTTATLSNGNLSLLTDLTTHAQMNFTQIFSAELFGTYKPSPTVYLGAAAALNLPPSDCAMVAAHLADLKAAKALGMQAIYVERSREEDWSQEEVEKAKTDGWVDLWISADQHGFMTMAEKLGIEPQEQDPLTRRRTFSE